MQTDEKSYGCVPTTTKDRKLTRNSMRTGDVADQTLTGILKDLLLSTY